MHIQVCEKKYSTFTTLFLSLIQKKLAKNFFFTPFPSHQHHHYHRQVHIKKKKTRYTYRNRICNTIIGSVAAAATKVLSAGCYIHKQHTHIHTHAYYSSFFFLLFCVFFFNYFKSGICLMQKKEKNKTSKF